MILDYLKVGPLDVNCSILVCPNSNEAIVIDPGGNEEDILARIAALDARVKLILITHSHFDHVIAGARLKKETGAPVCLPKKDRGVWRLMGLQFKLAKIEGKKPPRIDRFLKEGEKVSVGSLSLEVIHTPGHSPGGCAFYMKDENLIFAGDSLYRDSVGNWQVPFGNFEDLVRTLNDKFMTLPDNTRVIPGHGEETTIGREREHNPFLKPGRIEELREAERTRPGTFRMLLAMLLPKFFSLKSAKSKRTLVYDRRNCLSSHHGCDLPRIFQVLPSWGCTLYLRPDGVGVNFSCRDHGDPEPVDTVHEFGVTADEFIDMLKRVEAEGIARSSEFVMERRADGNFRLTFQNCFDGEENYCSFSEEELVNMMRMRRLFTGR